jgi:hypothetical protein
VGVLRKNIPNKLALMGRVPQVRLSLPWAEKNGEAHDRFLFVPTKCLLCIAMHGQHAMRKP